MTEERFNELLAGPLAHPLPMFTISRLALALKVVVAETGQAGEQALEHYCESRTHADQAEEESGD